MDPTRIAKPHLPVITEQASSSQDSSDTVQELKKIQAGVGEAKDSVEIKKDNPLFAVNTAKGEVRFGDRIQGKIPVTGDSNVQSSYRAGQGEQGNISVKDKESIPSKQRSSYFSGKTLTAGDLEREQSAIRDKRTLDGTEVAAKPNIPDVSSTGGAIDPNALVQYVLRESYVQNTEDLRFYAEKVKYFNETKKEVREHLKALKNDDAADKLNKLAPGKNENIMEELSSVIRDSVESSNDSKKHYLDLLQKMNKISSEISDQAQSISDASRRVSIKEKDDDP